jgi:endonuclease YncB( thermonuclease family)
MKTEGFLAGRVDCRALAGVTVAVCFLPSVGLADPCDLIPERGPMPTEVRSGQVFSGSVSYIGDGDSLCVALGPSHAQWAEVRLADFYAPELHDAGGPEAKATLSRLVEGKRIDCVAEHRSYDRVVAVCELRGRSVGDLMRSAGVREGGRGRQ